MEVKAVNKTTTLNDFSEIVKKAYEQGTREKELTLQKLMEDLKADLKNLMVG